MKKEELKILEMLDKAVQTEFVRDKIDKIIREIEPELVRNKDEIMVWRAIPLDTYTEPLPPEIKSSWVFILKRNAVTGAERHPNSHQRMMSYRGQGDFQTRIDKDWESHFLKNDATSRIEDRWISIPTNVWHQGVVFEENWKVVSFQTAHETELIEERPDPDDDSLIHRKTYNS